MNKLRQADVELAKGQTVAAVCKRLGVAEQTYFPMAEGVCCRAALRFAIDGAMHFGWMSVVLGVDSGPPARLVFDLLAWGYETEPNTPIEAGAVPAPSGALALLAFGAAAGATRARRE